MKPHNGRVLLEISPNGWRLECFPLMEFVRHMPNPQDALDRRAGRSPSDDVMYESFRAGDALLAAEGVHVWPEFTEGMWTLKVYVDGFNAADDHARLECFNAVRILIDRAVGEAVRLRFADTISLLEKAPSGEGLSLLELRDFLFEHAPGCREMSLETYARMPHEYGLSPNRDPHAPLLGDVSEGVTHLPAARLPLLERKAHRHGGALLRGRHRRLFLL